MMLLMVLVSGVAQEGRAAAESSKFGSKTAMVFGPADPVKLSVDAGFNETKFYQELWDQVEALPEGAVLKWSGSDEKTQMYVTKKGEVYIFSLGDDNIWHRAIKHLPPKDQPVVRQYLPLILVAGMMLALMAYILWRVPNWRKPACSDSI